MAIQETLQELKDFIDENPFNLTDLDITNLNEVYESMKNKYNV
ncbi:hypothetical protein [uncultured virus]|uniref:Uncharacterized protein n=1 Tax=uncultured virus TaxID=340016 RepID=A0A218MMR4_9VIRU|nr:hypothetical protein [uncultured virus]